MNINENLNSPWI